MKDKTFDNPNCRGGSKKGWNSGVKLIDKCGYATLHKGAVHISTLANMKSNAMMIRMGKKEWLAYLLGTIDEEGGIPTYNVEDIFIPEQEITSVSVDVTDNNKPPLNIIGTIHSHHDMGSFFSGVDTDYIGSNYPLTLVKSSNNVVGKSKRTLPCGSVMLADVQVFELYPQAVIDFLDEAEKKISEKTFTYDYTLPAQKGVSQFNIPTFSSHYPGRQQCDYCLIYYEERDIVQIRGSHICKDCLETTLAFSDKGQDEGERSGVEGTTDWKFPKSGKKRKAV